MPNSPQQPTPVLQTLPAEILIELDHLSLDGESLGRPRSIPIMVSTGLAMLVLAANQILPVQMPSQSNTGPCQSTGAAVCMCKAPKPAKQDRRPEQIQTRSNRDLRREEDEVKVKS